MNEGVNETRRVDASTHPLPCCLPTEVQTSLTDFIALVYTGRRLGRIKIGKRMERCVLKKKAVPAWAFTLLFFAPIVLLPVVHNAAANQDQPTIANGSVQVTAFTFNVYRKNYDI